MLSNDPYFAQNKSFSLPYLMYNIASLDIDTYNDIKIVGKYI